MHKSSQIKYVFSYSRVYHNSCPWWEVHSHCPHTVIQKCWNVCNQYIWRICAIVCRHIWMHRRPKWLPTSHKLRLKSKRWFTFVFRTRQKLPTKYMERYDFFFHFFFVVLQVDYEVTRLYNTFTERQKLYATYAEQFSKIHQISQQLGRCNMLLNQNLESMQVLNEMLDVDDRLTPFVWATNGVQIANKEHWRSVLHSSLTLIDIGSDKIALQHYMAVVGQWWSSWRW